MIREYDRNALKGKGEGEGEASDQSTSPDFFFCQVAFPELFLTDIPTRALVRKSTQAFFS